MPRPGRTAVTKTTGGHECREEAEEREPSRPGGGRPCQPVPPPRTSVSETEPSRGPAGPRQGTHPEGTKRGSQLRNSQQRRRENGLSVQRGVSGQREPSCVRYFTYGGNPAFRSDANESGGRRAGEISRTPAVEGRNLRHLTCMWELKQPHAMRAWGAGGQAARASGRQSCGCSGPRILRPRGTAWRL